MFLHVVPIISGKIEPFSPQTAPSCSHSTRWPIGSLSRRLHNTLCENRTRLLLLFLEEFIFDMSYNFV